MQFDKLTLKSQEAIQAAQQTAVQRGNQEIIPAHLAKAILEQQGGIVVPVLQKMGQDPSRVLAAVNQLIEKAPQVTGSGAGQVYMSNELRKLLDDAVSTARNISSSPFCRKTAQGSRRS